MESAVCSAIIEVKDGTARKSQLYLKFMNTRLSGILRPFIYQRTIKLEFWRLTRNYRPPTMTLKRNRPD